MTINQEQNVAVSNYTIYTCWLIADHHNKILFYKLMGHNYGEPHQTLIMKQ